MNTPSTDKDKSFTASYVRYDLSSVPDQFLNDPNSLECINEAINRLEQAETQQIDMDYSYEKLCEAVKSCMSESLASKTVHVSSGLSNKRRKVKKPWWTDKIDQLFVAFMDADKKWSKAYGCQKSKLKAERCHRQKDFDQEKQQAKRAHWKAMQERLLNLQSDNPKEYWKYIGNIGVRRERKQQIPWQVVLEDGSVLNDKHKVLQKF